QMRAEPNISIRREGSSELGVKTELKNINSFRALHRAILFEVERQKQLLEAGDTVVQETRGWSEAEQRTFSQRSKEFAEDYRYFPEPDIPPLELDRAWIEDLRRGLPELLVESVETGRTPAEIAAEHGHKQVSDESELRVLAEAVIDANPKAAADFRGGKKQAMQALMADLRKRAPQANPKVANELLLKLLA